MVAALRSTKNQTWTSSFHVIHFYLGSTLLVWMLLSTRFLFGFQELPVPPSASVLDSRDMIALDLQLQPPLSIRLRLFKEKAPHAARFVEQLIENQNFEECTIYRGEPVPAHWGSLDRPDRWDNGGRWGPPYALIQGGFLSGNKHIIDAVAEPNNPAIERGLVAWAGGKGGPHFFIALAPHPEWGHDHTVWAEVLEEDMANVHSLLERPLQILTSNNPVVTNFVDPIPFTMRKLGTKT